MTEIVDEKKQTIKCAKWFTDNSKLSMQVCCDFGWFVCVFLSHSWCVLACACRSTWPRRSGVNPVATTS